MSYVKATKRFAVVLPTLFLSACATAGAPVTTEFLLRPQTNEIRAAALSAEPQAGAQWGVGYNSESGIGDGERVNWLRTVCEVIANGSGQSSTSDTGTLSGSIGKKTTIAGSASANSGLECHHGCLPGDYSVGLAVTATYTIASSTPGVTFKTASGTTY